MARARQQQMQNNESIGQDDVVAGPQPSALDSERDLMRSILRGLPDLVFLKDPDGVYLGVNERTAAFYGLPEDRIVGRTDVELNPPELAATFRAEDLRAIAAGGPVVCREWLTFADGHTELNETTKTPLHAADGSLVGVLGVGHDITAQQRAEEALREQEERFEAIFHGSADAIALIDGDMHFVQANEAACELLGYTAEELERLAIWDIDATVPREGMDEFLARLAGEGFVRFATRHRRRDGELRDVEVSLRPIQIGGDHFQLAIWHDTTERLRRERDVAASERLLQQAQEIGALGSWTWDPATGQASASAETLRIYGLREPPSDLWATVERVAFEEDLPGLREQMARLVAGEDASRVEYRVLVDGEVRWIQSLGRVQRAHDGTVERIVGVSQDVTQAKLAAGAILASEARYHTLFDTAAVSIMLHDPDTGDTIEANPRALAAYGASSVDDLVAMRVFAAGPPYSADDALAYIRRALAEGRQQFEWRSLDLHGTEFWEHVILEPVELNGRTVAMSVSIDVTDRKLAEQELEFHRRHLEEMVGLRTAELAAANRRLTLSDQRLNSMLDLAQRAELLDEKSLLRHGLEEAVRLTGSRIGYVHFVNDDDTIELVTWSRDTLAQCDAVFDTHYPIALAGVWADSARWKHAVIHNEWETTPNRRGLPEGHIPLTRHLGVPVLDGGHVRMILGVGNKETPYDEGDADELRLIGTDLFRIAMRRRAEIALEHAKEAAESASRAKTTFLRNMSHEIRTPMSAIIGLTHLLRSEPLLEHQEERLGSIAENAEHLLKILNDVLDLSKIEAGKLVLEPSDFALGSVLEHLRSIEADQAAAKGLRLTMTVAPDVPSAFNGDGLRLAQVLINLLNNAIKFTAMGGVDLAISRMPERGDDWIRFAVRDSGIGIAPHDLERLFHSFEQADASTTRRYGGTGLGLAICRSLVELMGGTISVESRVAEGSAFMVEVPLAPADIENAPELATVAPPAPRMRVQERSAAAKRPGARVLLAEDSPVNQEVTAQLLRLAAVEVDTASDGREAVEAAAARTYDLVLMDVQMPVLDGLAATREIRALPGWANVPIVAMTANAFDEDRRACLEAGMNDHLAKPVDPDRLFASLERWVPLHGASSLTSAAVRTREPLFDRESASMRALLGSGSGSIAGLAGPDGGSAAPDGAARAAGEALETPATRGAPGRPAAPAANDGNGSSVRTANGAGATAAGGGAADGGTDRDGAATEPASVASAAVAAVTIASSVDPRTTAARAISRGAPAAAANRHAEDGAPTPDLLTAIAGIAGVEAEQWCSGGPKARATYLDLLARFAAVHVSDATTIRERIERGERRRAVRTTRTLERVASGLGLADVDASARRVLEAIDGEGPLGDAAERLAQLETRLHALVAALEDSGLGRRRPEAAGSREG